jgi:hypothetical protein
LTRKYTKKTKPEIEEPLTPEQVIDVLAFAQAAYGGQFRGIYTPQLVNARLQDITLSPLIATADKINTALENPKENEQQLIGYTEWLELNSMLFKRILGYFSGLMSFNWNYVCTNAEFKDYKSPAYKKDLAIVSDFFDKFNVKESFRIAMKEMMRNEAYFAVLREDGEKYILQELPQKYCKVTGRFDYGLLFDFDFYWFVQVSVGLEMYPPIFTRMYNEVFRGQGKRSIDYDPAATMDQRTGQFVAWHQTSPNDGFTCFKIAPELATRVPMLSPLMPNAVLEPIIRSLQTNSYIQQASKIIFGAVPLLKDQAAKLKNALAIDMTQMGQFLALMRAALPDAIKVAAAPLEDTKALEFEGSDTIYDSFLKTTAASSGVNARLLYSMDRQNIAETKLSLDTDQNVLRPVYYQFENWLNFHINKRTKKFKFKFMFEGFETYTNREERMKNANTLAEKGIVLEQKFASAVDMSPFDFRRMLEESKANGFVEKLTPIINASQMSGNSENKTGRPTMSDGDLSDSGATSREEGSNEEKGEE